MKSTGTKTKSPTLQQMDAAMEWVQRLSDDRNLAEKDVTDWLLWYESDPGNQQAFDELQRFWTQLGEVDEPANLAARLAAREGEAAPTTNSFVWIPSTHDVREKSRWWGNSRRAQLRGSIAAVALLAVSFGFFTSPYSPDPPLKLAADVPDEHPPEFRVRRTQLPDGSSVDLAARTSVAVQYTPDQRTLVLTSGEAFFSVAPNRSRPFVVKTSTVHVLAVGTKFNVRKESDRVVVTVVQGVVDVSSASGEAGTAVPQGMGQPITLNAGNEVTWFTRTGERIVRATASGRALAWRDGRLDYVNETLATVVADVNRYSDTRVIIRDPTLEQMTYTGTVFIQSLDEWLRAMPGEFPIKVVRENRQVTLEPLAQRHPVEPDRTN